MNNVFSPQTIIYRRLPFNWKNPIGYWIAVNLQLVFAATPLEFMGCFVSLAFASLIFVFSFRKDISDHLNEIDQDIKSKKLRSKVMEQLAELIQFTQLRQLSSFHSIII